jgi:hypothetical protein
MSPSWMSSVRRINKDLPKFILNSKRPLPLEVYHRKRYVWRFDGYIGAYGQYSHSREGPVWTTGLPVRPVVPPGRSPLEQMAQADQASH